MILFVSLPVWCVLGYPMRELCQRGYSGQVVVVAVACVVQSYVLELRSVVFIPAFDMLICASIAVRVAVGMLLNDVQGVLGMHASLS